MILKHFGEQCGENLAFLTQITKSPIFSPSIGKTRQK
jgi:hypothetical protein